MRSIINALNHVIIQWTAGELVIILLTAISLIVIAKLYINGKLDDFLYEDVVIIECGGKKYEIRESND